ncbi:MAG: hypothetical protein AAFX39_06960 [Pseudomonadota bacterium]
MTPLEDTLRELDGTSTDPLSELGKTLGDQPAVLSGLIRLADHDAEPISDRATWLLLDLLRHDVRLTRTQTGDLVDRLAGITSWQAQLHICQSGAYLDVTAAEATIIADWLTPMLRSKRPFLRAWSMDALQHLAAHRSDMIERAEAALQAAEQDPAASVRARARHWR